MLWGGLHHFELVTKTLRTVVQFGVTDPSCPDSSRSGFGTLHVVLNLNPIADPYRNPVTSSIRRQQGIDRQIRALVEQLAQEEETDHEILRAAFGVYRGPFNSGIKFQKDALLVDGNAQATETWRRPWSHHQLQYIIKSIR